MVNPYHGFFNGLNLNALKYEKQVILCSGYLLILAGFACKEKGTDPVVEFQTTICQYTASGKFVP
jgi:hypothetical protein